ncbi:MAG: hypothetical protein OK442_00010 [Thaumarchaeota archaeon]|nr:hypothetical protein [Nitrososphaerota archaeon]
MSSAKRNSRMTKPLLVAFLVLFYSGAASASAGLQFFSQPVGLPVTPPPGGIMSSAGGYFFVDVQVPQGPQPSGGNAIYAAEGGSYLLTPGPGQGLSPAALQSGAVLPIWEAQETRRSRFRIYIEILDILKGGPMTPFEIAFRLRLNSKRAKGYVRRLEEKGLLESINGDDLVAVTARGRSFAEEMHKAIILD